MLAAIVRMKAATRIAAAIGSLGSRSPKANIPPMIGTRFDSAAGERHRDDPARLMERVLEHHHPVDIRRPSSRRSTDWPRCAARGPRRSPRTHRSSPWCRGWPARTRCLNRSPARCRRAQDAAALNELPRRIASAIEIAITTRPSIAPCDAPAESDIESRIMPTTIAMMPAHSAARARSPRTTTEKITNSAMPPCIITATIETGACETAVTNKTQPTICTPMPPGHIGSRNQREHTANDCASRAPRAARRRGFSSSEGRAPSACSRGLPAPGKSTCG